MWSSVGMNKASAQQLLLLSRVAWGRRRRNVCLCVCVCVSCCCSKAASSTWGHRYGAVYTVTSDQHPCHSYDYFGVYLLLTQGIITQWQWITWLTCVLCAPQVDFYFFWVTNFVQFFSTTNLLGKIFGYNFFFKLNLSNFYLLSLWEFFPIFLYHKIEGEK